MKLGVPTLCRYDLLRLLLDSAERGSLKPDGYVIVDNGGKARAALRLPPNTEVIEPGRNLGVAASWNVLLDLAGDTPIVISNDDVTFGQETFSSLVSEIETHPTIVTATTTAWSLFAQAPECTRRVGYYDENFWPAYHEDVDYAYRLRLAGVERRPVALGHTHAGSATLKAKPDVLTGGNRYAYYKAKWGGPAKGERYREPFDGKPPEGWTLRTAKPWRPERQRERPRSIIDHIYRRGR